VEQAAKFDMVLSEPRMRSGWRSRIRSLPSPTRWST